MTSLPVRNRTRPTAIASVGALILTTLALTGASASAAEPPSRWGPTVTLSGTPVLGSPDVAAGPQGGINVAWGGDGDVRFRRMPPSSPWLGERSLGAGGSPRVGVDGKGNVTAVWFRQRRLMITEIVTARRPIGGTWSRPRIISQTGEDEQDGTGVRDLDLSVSPGG
ncbi:MAG TPA: hypothetical protein VFQ11_10315, partial [Nocardioidaceae bacterium]|nr:hypothetical protein [Nocardioidaceae bacterium]